MMPYPVRAQGVSIRYLPVIQHLSKKHVIDIAVIDDGNVELDKVDDLKEFCRDVFVIANPKFETHTVLYKAVTQGFLLMPWSPPTTASVYNMRRIEERLESVTRGRQYDVLLWVDVYYSPVLFALSKFISAKRLVLDFIDSPYLLLKRKIISLNSPILHKYESWKMKRWEAKLAEYSTHTIYISDVDAESVQRKLADGSSRQVIPNGLYVEGYTSTRSERVSSPNIGFLGNMGYPPNIEAVVWLYEQVFVPLSRKVDNLLLYVIGRNPPVSIRDLGKNPGVTVTGAVDNIWPYVNAVDVFVFPLWKGAGLKNKVLEAMYAKKPVVTTPIGNEGIEAVQGRDLRVCHRAEDFRKEVLSLLESPANRAEMGASAHHFVAEKFGWPGILREFEAAIIGDEESAYVRHN
jgi:glycosyltransferase involved in cell wall biosynthesis